MSEGHSANVERIIANVINEQARGDPSALAPHIIAALEKAGYRITPATEDTALGSQPFDELTPDMRPHDVHGLREPGSTWSRAIWSAIRCLRDMMFCWSPIQSMCSPPRTMLTCYASCADTRRRARTCCSSIFGWIRVTRSLWLRPSCRGSS